MKAELWNEAVNLLDSQKDSNALIEALTILLTPEERNAIGSRLAIIKALLAGNESQREIAARLGVSIATITRGSNMLKTLNNDQKNLIGISSGCRAMDQ